MHYHLMWGPLTDEPENHLFFNDLDLAKQEFKNVCTKYTNDNPEAVYKTDEDVGVHHPSDVGIMYGFEDEQGFMPEFMVVLGSCEDKECVLDLN